LARLITIPDAMTSHGRERMSRRPLLAAAAVVAVLAVAVSGCGGGSGGTKNVSAKKSTTTSTSTTSTTTATGKSGNGSGSGSGSAKSSTATSAPTPKPMFTTATVSPGAVYCPNSYNTSVQVTITWAAVNTQSVDLVFSQNTETGFPPRGSMAIFACISNSMTFVAHGPGGTTSASVSWGHLSPPPT
jgi:hypothetical protein